jgi:hypothetical protein
MDLALLVRHNDDTEEVVTTTQYGKVGSYRNRGIYGHPGDAQAALQEFQLAFPDVYYFLRDAKQVAHQNRDTRKWEIFEEYTGYYIYHDEEEVYA